VSPMVEAFAPALYALFLWWFGTGAVLWLDRLPKASQRLTMTIATVALGVALAALHATADTQTLAGALIAFSATIVVWGWHELSFLTGWITGPRRTPCPPDARGWRRFGYAAETLIHHEIAIALTGVALAVWLWDAANPVAMMTYGILWGMRLSAKLNIFIGAPNVAEEFLPDDLAYLKSYFSKRPINPLFPVSVTVGTFGAVQGLRPEPDGAGFAADVFALAAMLTALGVLEHWFLVLPIKEAALWRWYMNTRARRRANRAGKALDLSPLRAPTT
jgi:putative photosynthetic complex assembly protein 2